MMSKLANNINILKMHDDVLSAPTAIDELFKNYLSTGYDVKRITPISFRFYLTGGYVDVYWSNGKIYEKIVEDNENAKS